MSLAERRCVPWLVVAGACLAALGCGSLHSPTEPKPNPKPRTSASVGSSDPNVVLGGAPAPTASPSASPSPDAGGQPSPPPTGAEGATDCGQPLPPAISTINVKVHLRGTDNWILDSTPLVGARRRLLPGDRLHGRPLDLPGPSGGQPPAWRVRALRRRARQGHRQARPDVVPQRGLLHRQVARLREQRRQPVPAEHVRLRHVQGLRRERPVRRSGKSSGRLDVPCAGAAPARV